MVPKKTSEQTNKTNKKSRNRCRIDWWLPHGTELWEWAKWPKVRGGKVPITERVSHPDERDSIGNIANCTVIVLYSDRWQLHLVSTTYNIRLLNHYVVYLKLILCDESILIKIV